MAQLNHLHGHKSRKVASIVAWGGVLPVVGLAFAPVTLGGSLAVTSGAYAALFGRVYRHRLSRDDRPEDAALYAAATTIAKLAELKGVSDFAWNHLVRGRDTGLYEYKTGEGSQPDPP